MNDKMNKVASNIFHTMPKVFPDSYLGFVFSGFIDIDDFILSVMLECAKHAYDTTLPKHSMRHFLQENNMLEVDIAMRYSRIQDYVNDYRKREYDYRMKDVNPEDVRLIEHLKELLPPDMSSIEGKKEGYKLTKMNFFEMTTIWELEFCKAFTEKRLMSTKSIDNSTFVQYCQKVDEFLVDLNNRFATNDEEAVFSTMAAFTLEWKYAYDFIYYVADAMCRQNVKEIPDARRRLVALCGDIDGESMLGGSFKCHSRLLRVRKKYIDLSIEESVDSEQYEKELRRLIEAIGLVSRTCENLTIEGTRLKEWFVRNTEMGDWASICRDYDIFSYVNGVGKDWQHNRNKRIRYMREAFSVVTQPKLQRN